MASKQASKQVSTSDSLHVSRVSIRNFKRIETVCLNTKERVLIALQGPNKQGKTSVLDAVETALCGKRAAPKEPLRRGSKKGEVVLDLCDDLRERYRIIRRFTPRDSYLEVTDLVAGAPVTSPQDFLSSLVIPISFDPTVPLTTAMLLGALGLEEQYNKLMGERAKAFEARTQANRDVKTAKAQAASKTDPSPDKLLKPISPDELVSKLKTITENNSKIDEANRELETASETISKLEQELAAARKSKTEWQAYRKTLGERQDSASLDAEAARVKAHNDRATLQAEARRLAKAYEEAEGRAADLDDQVKGCDTKARSLLAGALARHKGLAGLSLDEEGGLLLNDLPTEQASGMETIRLGVAVGMAMNPRLALFAVDELDKLDGEALDELVRLAGEHDALILGTCVWSDLGGQDADDRVIVQIREGRLLGDSEAGDEGENEGLNGTDDWNDE